MTSPAPSRCLPACPGAAGRGAARPAPNRPSRQDPTPAASRRGPGPLRRLVVALLLGAAAFTTTHAGFASEPGNPPAPSRNDPSAMDSLAHAYVRLVLEAGTHDANLVDAYYGPAELRSEAEKSPRSLAALTAEADRILAALPAAAPAASAPEIARLRHHYLLAQTKAVRARLAFLAGTRMSFDEESRALYDAVAPHRDEASFAAAIERLAAALPADTAGAPFPDRLERFRRDFTIPPDRLAAVFEAAIAACRARTAAHLELPAGESFTIAYVTDKPWSAYNWYQGNYRSLIEVNTSLPVLIDRALDLACHEGYPGHHAYNVLLERHLVRERGWPEFAVYPLFSPQSLIAEGTANFGIEVAFPGPERLAFERDVLFPLAGLDPARAEEFDRVRQLLDELSYAGNEAARRYLDGAIDAATATDWLVRFAAMSPERARQRVRFFDTYRSYVINYNLGQDLVRRYVEALGGTADRPERRWEIFRELLSSPRLPSGLDVPATEKP
jgi:hypothetical protein